MTDTNLVRTIQSLQPGDMVTLFTFDLTSLGGGLLYYTPMTNDGAVIRFGGINYLPLVVEADGFTWSGEGALPRPRLSVSNVQRTAATLAITYQDLIGATFTRTRTFSQFLDDGVDPDPTAKLPDDIYTINRKVAHSPETIEWELASSIDQQGRKLPGRQALRDLCTQRYRIYDPGTGDFDYAKATCPYTGAEYFDAGGNSTTIDKDVCSKLLSQGCRLRFGENGELPTRAFPGISRTRT